MRPHTQFFQAEIDLARRAITLPSLTHVTVPIHIHIRIIHVRFSVAHSFRSIPSIYSYTIAECARGDPGPHHRKSPRRRSMTMSSSLGGHSLARSTCGRSAPRPRKSASSVRMVREPCHPAPADRTQGGRHAKGSRAARACCGHTLRYMSKSERASSSTSASASSSAATRWQRHRARCSGATLGPRRRVARGGSGPALASSPSTPPKTMSRCSKGGSAKSRPMPAAASQRCHGSGGPRRLRAPRGCSDRVAHFRRSATCRGKRRTPRRTGTRPTPRAATARRARCTPSWSAAPPPRAARAARRPPGSDSRDGGCETESLLVHASLQKMWPDKHGSRRAGCRRRPLPLLPQPHRRRQAQRDARAGGQRVIDGQRLGEARVRHLAIAAIGDHRLAVRRRLDTAAARGRGRAALALRSGRADSIVEPAPRWRAGGAARRPARAAPRSAGRGASGTGSCAGTAGTRGTRGAAP